MTYRELVNFVLRAYPGPKDASLEQDAKDSIRTKQLVLAGFRPEGWPWLRREARIHFGGGYDEGTVAVTHDSTTVTLTSGTWPADVVGWVFGVNRSEQELYRVKTRSSDTVVLLERPYEGETLSGVDYATYDAKGALPVDYMMGIRVACEPDGAGLGWVDIGYAKGFFPKMLTLGSAKVVALSERSVDAGYSTGTVTLVKGSTAIVGSGTTFPTWCEGHLVRFHGERQWYRIKTRTDATNLVLERAYGGDWAGAARTYEIDPAGALQIEYLFPREDHFSLRLDYFAVPEELVNDTDAVEGPENYAWAIANGAAASLLMSLPAPMLEQYGTKARKHEKEAESLIQGLIAGRSEPRSGPVMHDIRNAGRMTW